MTHRMASILQRLRISQCTLHYRRGLLLVARLGCNVPRTSMDMLSLLAPTRKSLQTRVIQRTYTGLSSTSLANLFHPSSQDQKQTVQHTKATSRLCMDHLHDVILACIRHVSTAFRNESLNLTTRTSVTLRSISGSNLEALNSRTTLSKLLTSKRFCILSPVMA